MRGKTLGLILEKQRFMNFWSISGLLFLMLRRTAHGAAGIAAVLAECAVRAGVLLTRFLLHVLFYTTAITLYQEEL